MVPKSFLRACAPRVGFLCPPQTVSLLALWRLRAAMSLRRGAGDGGQGAVGATRMVRSFAYRTRPGGAFGILRTWRLGAMSTSTALSVRAALWWAASWAARSTV